MTTVLKTRPFRQEIIICQLPKTVQLFKVQLLSIVAKIYHDRRNVTSIRANALRCVATNRSSKSEERLNWKEENTSIRLSEHLRHLGVHLKKTLIPISRYPKIEFATFAGWLIKALYFI